MRKRIWLTGVLGLGALIVLTVQAQPPGVYGPGAGGPVMGGFPGGPGTVAPQPGRYVVARADLLGIVVLDTQTGELFRAADRDLKPYSELRARTGGVGIPGGMGMPGMGTGMPGLGVPDGGAPGAGAPPGMPGFGPPGSDLKAPSFPTIKPAIPPTPPRGGKGDFKLKLLPLPKLEVPAEKK